MIFRLISLLKSQKRGVFWSTGPRLMTWQAYLTWRLTWCTGHTQGATWHWGHVAEPGRPTQGAGGADTWQEATKTVHVGARVGRWRDETARSSISSGIASKIIPNIQILGNSLELRGIMVNMGRIHRELRIFLTCSSNLIKSDEKSMEEIGENGILWK